MPNDEILPSFTLQWDLKKKKRLLCLYSLKGENFEFLNEFLIKNF